MLVQFRVRHVFRNLWRADRKKDAIEDLRKAAWYIEREIERRSGEV